MSMYDDTRDHVVPMGDMPGGRRNRGVPERSRWRTLTICLHHVWVLTQKIVRDSVLTMHTDDRAAGWRMSGALTVSGLMLMAYFTYHALAGSHGLFALMDMRERRDALSAELAIVRAERERLERRVDLLDDDRLDPDMLEESAGVSLGYVRPGDLVILRQPSGSPHP